MIQVEKITKRFNDVEAVRDISFEADDGCITALLGPNGAGKSTTLRILAGVIEADTGKACIAGVDVRESPMEIRRNIGVMPHNSGLYARLTGIENIAYFGQLQGLSKQQVNQRIDNLVEQLDMGDFAQRRTAGFSQGQKVKVALARALIHDPKHIILDEPTNGLDVMATRALRKIINDLKAQDKCILFSSHIMQEVDALCDNVVVIGHGEVKFSDTIHQMRQHAGTQDLEEAFIKMAGIEEEQPGAGRV